MSAQSEQRKNTDKILLLKNVMQLMMSHVEDSTGGKFDRVDEAHEKEWERIVAASGDAFRAWFGSDDGEKLIEQYLSSHSDEDIEEGKGIDELIQAFRLTQAH